MTAAERLAEQMKALLSEMPQHFKLSSAAVHGDSCMLFTIFFLWLSDSSLSKSGSSITNESIWVAIGPSWSLSDSSGFSSLTTFSLRACPLLWEVVFGAWTAAGVVAAAGILVLSLLLLFLSDTECGGKLSGGFRSVALVSTASLCGFTEFLEDLRRKKQVVRACPHNHSVILWSKAQRPIKSWTCLKGFNVHLNRRCKRCSSSCVCLYVCLNTQHSDGESISGSKSNAECSHVSENADVQVPALVGQIQSSYPQCMVCGEYDSVHRSPAQDVVNDFHSHCKTWYLCPPHTAINRLSGAQLQSLVQTWEKGWAIPKQKCTSDQRNTVLKSVLQYSCITPK